MRNVSNSRNIRVQIATETLAILEAGSYLNQAGKKVVFKESLERAIENSILYRPDSFELLEKEIRQLLIENAGREAKIEITSETTLEAARRLVVTEGIKETACLNFASAKNPGGGFLNGSQAQEESLARASGLYPCIAQMQEMYDYNRSLKHCYYSDYLSYAPEVPVLRDDHDQLLDELYLVSMITAPAVNAGVVQEREADPRPKIRQVMLERIKKILLVAALKQNRVLILGAYGCGVFRNQTEDVADYFRVVLFELGLGVLFERIVFAIYESRGEQDKKMVFKQVLRG